MALTQEQIEARKVALAKGRETAAANRKAALEKAAAGAAPEPKPVAMPPIVYEDAGGHMESVPSDFVSELAPDDDPLDEFQRFLAAQDADIRSLLSDMELRVIYEAEQKRAADEKKAAAKKTAVVRAQRHARATAGLIGPEAIAAAAVKARQSRKVSWIVNMPEAGNSGTLVDQGVRINGNLYVHGTEMTGTVADYESYREIEYRAHENERQFQGRSRMSRLSQSGMRFLNNEGHL